MMKFRENEDAVSPVIGVILMVAITVILAAVIAAFVFGMAGSVDSKNKVVAATASSTINSDDAKTVYITYQGGPDADLVQEITYTVMKEDGSETKTLTGGDEGTVTVGATASVPGTENKDHVVVTAIFKDKTSQVILDTFV